MVYHSFHLLRLVAKLDGLTIMFVAYGSGLFLFLWPLRGLLLKVLLE